MNNTTSPNWRPAIFAVGVLLLTLALAWAPRAQATERLLQIGTIPTPTEQTTLPPGRRDTPTPRGETETPPPPGPGISPAPGSTIPPAPTAAVPSAGGLAVTAELSRQDVLPGDELQIRLWLNNDSSAAVTGVILTDLLDPSLVLLRVSATQGAVEVQGQSIVLRMGALEPGQSSLVLLDVRVGDQVQPGQIILNQAIAYWNNGQVSSNVVAAGLPPDRLPATGADRRGP